MDEEIRNGNIEGARKLLNASGLPLDPDWKDNCLLRAAIRHKQTEAVKLLLQEGALHEKLPYSFQIETNHTFLHLAVRLCCLEIINVLLSKGASLYAVNDNEETPLILAAAMGNNCITDQILSFISTEKNCSRKDGFSHFHIACMRNNVQIVKGFLRRGVDIDARMNLKSSYHPGYTALHFAAEFQCVEVVELLVNCGADITVKNRNELTPLHLAFGNRNETIIDLILSVHRYATANPKDSEGLTHFHIACTRNNPKIVESFLQWGVDVNLKTNENALNWSSYTPLYFAIEYECIDVVKLLLSHNPDDSSNSLDQAYRIPNVSIFKLFYSVFELEKLMATEKYSNLSNFHVACINNDVAAVQNLLNNDVPVNSRIDLNSPTWLSSTPLHLAVQQKHLDIVRLLIGSGADLTAKDTRRKTALHVACEIGDNNIVDLILSAHANVRVNSMDDQGLSHFHIAVARDNLNIVNHFLQNGVDINSQVSSESAFWPGYTALHFACNFKCTQVIELLLNQSALITFKNGLGLTPLELMFTKVDSYTSEEDKLIEMIDLILSGPEENYSNVSTDSGLSLFHLACARSNTPLVKRLSNPQIINQPVSLPNWSGRTPLHFAAYFDNQEVIELLLQLGADPRIEDIDGFNALALWWDKNNKLCEGKDYICEKLLYYPGDINSKAGLFHFFIACEYSHLNAVEYFLKRGINPNTAGYSCDFCVFYDRTMQDCTALHAVLCSHYPSESVIEILLKYGANINKIDTNMNTLLHISSFSYSVDSNVVKLLLKEGADRDVNARDIYGDTPLHVSCMDDIDNCLEKTRLLLEYGADLNIENNDGHTPFTYTFADGPRDGRWTVLLLEHVKKLQIIGFPVTEKNAREYSRLVELQAQDDDEEFDEDVIVSLCESEINNMNTIKLNSNATLRDIVFKDSHAMALLVQNIEFRRILESEDFDDKFPNYGYLLKLQFKKGSKRRKLLVPAQAAVRFLSGIQLLDDCSEHVIQYLSDESLEIVIEAMSSYSR